MLQDHLHGKALPHFHSLQTALDTHHCHITCHMSLKSLLRVSLLHKQAILRTCVGSRHCHHVRSMQNLATSEEIQFGIRGQPQMLRAIPIPSIQRYRLHRPTMTTTDNNRNNSSSNRIQSAVDLDKSRRAPSINTVAPTLNTFGVVKSHPVQGCMPLLLELPKQQVHIDLLPM